MILSDYHELPDDIDDEDLDMATDEAVFMARRIQVLVESDPYLRSEDLASHLKVIYPVWLIDSGAWSQLLKLSDIRDETITLIHESCCDIFDKQNSDTVSEPWELSSEAV